MPYSFCFTRSIFARYRRGCARLAMHDMQARRQQTRVLLQNSKKANYETLLILLNILDIKLSMISLGHFIGHRDKREYLKTKSSTFPLHQ